MIEVTAAAAGNSLELSVKDDGPGYQPASEVGVGISNTRARLKTLFGAVGKLEIASGTNGGTIATVTLPLRRSGDG